MVNNVGMGWDAALVTGISIPKSPGSLPECSGSSAAFELAGFIFNKHATFVKGSGRGAQSITLGMFSGAMRSTPHSLKSFSLMLSDVSTTSKPSSPHASSLSRLRRPRVIPLSAMFTNNATRLQSSTLTMATSTIVFECAIVSTSRFCSSSSLRDSRFACPHLRPMRSLLSCR